MKVIAVPYFMGERLHGLDVPLPHREVAPEMPADTPQDRMGALYAELARAVSASEQRPEVWAGDCVAALGVLAGLQRAGIDALLVWFDAHGDFNTWETTPSGFIGGMPLAMAVGRGDQTIARATGLAPISEERAVLVGARDLDPGEGEAVEESGMTVLSVAEAALWEPPPGPIYLHVDADVVDPSDMPAMNYPAPGGPALEMVEAAVAHFAAGGRLAAFSLSLWNPELIGAGVAAAACRRLAQAAR